jgi:hypothetical protein
MGVPFMGLVLVSMPSQTQAPCQTLATFGKSLNVMRIYQKLSQPVIRAFYKLHNSCAIFGWAKIEWEKFRQLLPAVSGGKTR